MNKAQLMEIVDLIIKLINKRIPGNEEELETIQRQVFGFIDKDYKANKPVAYDLEVFYTDILKLFACMMKADEKGKIKHELVIDTDELFQALQKAYEETKNSIYAKM